MSVGKPWRNGARIVAVVGAMGLVSVAAHFAQAEHSAQGSQAQHRDEQSGERPRFSWTRVSVELPSSQALFPPGEGADTANSQCLMCHSAEMVLLQPPLTRDEWRAEINKMRNVYGSPLPADQLEALAGYLSRINGR